MRLGVAAKWAGATIGLLVAAGALFLAATIQSTGPHHVGDTQLVMRQIQNHILIHAVKHRCMPTNFVTIDVAGVDAWGRPILLLVPDGAPEGQYALLSLGRDGVVGGGEVDTDIVMWAAMPGNVAPLPCENPSADPPKPQ